MKVISCSGNLNFSNNVCSILNIKPVEARIKNFSDGEIWVEIMESIRGKNVFIVQSLCAPVNDNLMELCIVTDAAKRASCQSITTIIPYFGYARQDRKSSPRSPISAKLLANMIQVSGVDRLISVDMHAGQIQGFFDIPVDDLATDHIFGQNAELMAHEHGISAQGIVIVSPDVGGIKRARRIAKRLEANIAIIDKRRPEPGVCEVLNIIGDVKGKVCMIVDDIVDSAGTLCRAAEAIIKEGGKAVSACITHPVLSGNAAEKIQNSELSCLYVSDSIPLSEQAKKCDKIKLTSIAEMIASVMSKVDRCESVSEFFGYPSL